jgi:hypothetical protein
MAYIIKHGFGLQEVIDISSTVTIENNKTVLYVKNSNNNKIISLGSETGGHSVFYLADSTGVNKIGLFSGWYSWMEKSFHIGGVVSSDSSSILETSSTTRGFLPPRMTTTQKNAISSPATGLVVYDTTLNKLCVYTGSAWETITSA